MVLKHRHCTSSGCYYCFTTLFVGMHDIGWWPISDRTTFFNLFWLITIADSLSCTGNKKWLRLLLQYITSRWKHTVAVIFRDPSPRGWLYVSQLKVCNWTNIINILIIKLACQLKAYYNHQIKEMLFSLVSLMLSTLILHSFCLGGAHNSLGAAPKPYWWIMEGKALDAFGNVNIHWTK